MSALKYKRVLKSVSEEEAYMYLDAFEEHSEIIQDLYEKALKLCYSADRTVIGCNKISFMILVLLVFVVKVGADEL